MGILRQLAAGLRSLLHRDASDRDIADEVRHYLEEAKAELIRGGASPDEAERSVRLRYGDPGAVREDVRAYGWENVVGTLLADLHYGARRLRLSPGFTAVAVLTLGLGVGSATAIVSAVSPVLFQPLAYPNPERLVAIYERAQTGGSMLPTFGTYRELMARSRAFERIAAFKPWEPALIGDGEPERLLGQRVSADYFRVLGVPPALGSDFDAVDDRVDGPNVVVLSDGLWRRRFGADTTIVGREIRLNGLGYTVVGVMPAGFENIPGRPAEAWALLQYDALLPSFDGREWGHHLEMAARLRSHVDKDAALYELNRIAAAPIAETPRPSWASLRDGMLIQGLLEAVTSGSRPTMIAMLGAAVLLLLISVLNVTNLVLARGARRGGELALRTALGAGRRRLLRQLLTEGVLLAGLGSVVALLLARLGTAALVAIAPPQLPRLDDIRVNGIALLFALTVTAGTGVLLGIAPALGATRRNVERAVRRVGGRVARGHLATRRALVVTEVALALVLLVGAGLLLRSVQRLLAVPLGFDTTEVLAVQVQAAGDELLDDDSVYRFFSDALEAVRRLPGVTSAALTSQLPLSGQVDVYGVSSQVDGLGNGEDGAAYRYAVSPDYFGTMAIPLVEGRLLDQDDVAGAPVAVVISESFARSVYPDKSAVGQRIHVGRTDLPWYTIVGVVGDVKQDSRQAVVQNAVYLTPLQWYFVDRTFWFVVRTDRDAATLTAAVRRAIWSVNPNQPIVRVTTLEEVAALSEGRRRFALTVLEAFAALALLLAGIGLYGVLATNVGERMRELGVRTALGASRRSIVALVVRQGVALTLVGVVIGLVVAILASEALVTLLFGVTRVDPVTYAGVVTLLAAVAAVACWVPARRALRVDTVLLLKSE